MPSFKRFPLTPSGEMAPPKLYDSRLRWAMLRSRWAHHAQGMFESHVIRPLEDRLFKRWMDEGPLSGQVEAMGLPYRSVDTYLANALDLVIEPRGLTCSLSMKASFPKRSALNRAKNQFIWQGDWDLTRFDFRAGYRYRFISDIWAHRSALEQSVAYVDLNRKLEEGKPFRSHQKGILLNTPEKILEYLNIYIGYMESMQQTGFDNTQGKDRLGVAIDRNGGIVKVNRGLHRLAMAQVLGLDEIMVRVRAVHADWWRDVTQGTTGEQALELLIQALPACRPAS